MEEESEAKEDEEDWDSGEEEEPDQEGIDVDNMRPIGEAAQAMAWSNKEIVTATTRGGVRGEVAGELIAETAEGGIDGKGKRQASLPATCGEKEAGTRSEERRDGERVASHQREAEGTGGAGAGSWLEKSLEAAEGNNPRERNLVQ